MEIQTREKIQAGLRKFRGSISELAKSRGVSTEWVRRVLSGMDNDDDLVVEAAKLWKQLEAERAIKLGLAEQLAADAEEIATTAHI